MKIKLVNIVIGGIVVLVTFGLLHLFFNKIAIFSILTSISQIFLMIVSIILMYQSTKSLRESRKRLAESIRQTNSRTAIHAINRNRDAFPNGAMGISLRGITCPICGAINTDGHQCGHLKPPEPSTDLKPLFPPLKVRKIEFISRGQNGNK